MLLQNGIKSHRSRTFDSVLQEQGLTISNEIKSPLLIWIAFERGKGTIKITEKGKGKINRKMKKETGRGRDRKERREKENRLERGRVRETTRSLRRERGRDIEREQAQGKGKVREN